MLDHFHPPRLGKLDAEFELVDTGVFDDHRYFDVFAEYAKAAPEDVLIRITIANRGPNPATIHLLPTLWFRNTWSWGCTHEGCEVKPRMEISGDSSDPTAAFPQIIARHVTRGNYRLFAEPHATSVPQLLMTENQTNNEQLSNTANECQLGKTSVFRLRDHVVDGTGIGAGRFNVRRYCLQVLRAFRVHCRWSFWTFMVFF